MRQAADQKLSVELRGGCDPNFIGSVCPFETSTRTLVTPAASKFCPVSGSVNFMRKTTWSPRTKRLVRMQGGGGPMRGVLPSTMSPENEIFVAPCAIAD